MPIPTIEPAEPIDDSAHLVIDTGDITRCPPAWSLSGPAVTDHWLKMYIPLSGDATITLRGQKFPLQTNRVYLFNSTLLEEQRCRDHFFHCWLHCAPASPRIKQLFFKKFTIAEWPRSELPLVDELLDGFKRLAARKRENERRNGAEEPNRHSIHLADKAFRFKIQAFLTYLVGDCMERQHLELDPQEQAALDRLLPAIEFMDKNYRASPPIEIIAQTVHLSPSHFNRLFVQHFTVSPKKYLIRKRLAEARGLLLNTSLAAKEIAARCGYENEFYFSKAFKKEYGAPPSRFRNMDFAS